MYHGSAVFFIGPPTNQPFPSPFLFGVQVTLVVGQNEAPPPAAPCDPLQSKGVPAQMVDCSIGSAQFTPQSVAGATVLQLTEQPSFCLGLLPASTFVGIMPCSAGDVDQRWRIGSQTVTNVGHDGHCLDIFGQNASSFAPLDVYACNGGSNQDWTLRNGTLVSSLNDLCVGFCYALQNTAVV